MTFDWQVPLIVAAIIGGILYFSRRSKGEADPEPDVDGDLRIDLERDAVPTTTSSGSEPTARLSGSDLVDQIQRTLGIGILVESVQSVGATESAETDEQPGPVTIRATFMSGRHTTPVAVTGDSEEQAWDELAKAAIAWRNSDYQHIPLWWGGGG